MRAFVKLREILATHKDVAHNTHHHESDDTVVAQPTLITFKSDAGVYPVSKDAQHRARHAFLKKEESRLTDFIKEREDTEERLFIEGNHIEAIRQRSVTRRAKRELKRVQAEIRATALAD